MSSPLGRLKQYRQLLIGLAIGLAVAIPTGLYIRERSMNSELQIEKEPTAEVQKEASQTTELTEATTQDTATSEPAQAGTANSTNLQKPSQPPASTPQAITPPPAPTPTQKSPYTFTFSSGNRSATWYTGDTFFPGKGYTDEWVSVTGQADATGFLNMRVSYNCSSGSACPGMILQGRNDGGGWIDYKTLQGSSGTVTYPVLYSYYRLLLSSGSCSSNACPPPTPPFPITYELSATGYYYY